DAKPALEKYLDSRKKIVVPTIDVSDREMKRYGIDPVLTGFVNAILEILRELTDYLPVNLRAIHYRLLNLSFFRNQKHRTRYRNDRDSYQALSRLATKMRLNGQIPWDALTDETRPVTVWQCWEDATEFLAEQSENFLKNFSRDLLQSQYYHFE